ncbi:MAG TPA: Ltp family lipoprotein [Nocardioides sp.]
MSQQYPNYTNSPAPQQPIQPAPPQPGKPPKKPMRKEAKIGWLILGGLGAVALIGSAFLPDASSDTTSTSKPSTVVTSVDTGPTPDPITTPTNKPSAAKPTVQPTETEGTGCDLNSSPEEYADCLDRFVNGATTAPQPTKAAPKLTASQEQAIGSAESYLEYTAFSRKGLIRQLSSDAGEGFSVADATFAVDHIKVNWNEQAARSAKSYLAMTHFSRKGLIHQLESSAGEGFTHAQAVYGVNRAGL